MKILFRLSPLPYIHFFSLHLVSVRQSQHKGPVEAYPLRGSCVKISFPFFLPLNFWSISMSLNGSASEEVKTRTWTLPKPPTASSCSRYSAGEEGRTCFFLWPCDFSMICLWLGWLDVWQVCHFNRLERDRGEWECVIHREINALQNAQPTLARHKTASSWSTASKLKHVRNNRNLLHNSVHLYTVRISIAHLLACTQM